MIRASAPHETEIAPGIRKARIERRRALERRFGILQPSGDPQRGAKVVVDDGMLRSSSGGALQPCNGGFGIAAPQRDRRGMMQRIGMFGVVCEDGLVKRGRLVKPAGPLMGDCRGEEIVGCHDGHVI